MKNAFLKLPQQFDIQKLRADLDICLQLKWKDHFNKNDYEGQWDVIALRAPDGAGDNITAHVSQNYQDTPLLGKCSYFKYILDSFKVEKESVRLMKLAAGSEIKEHRDYKSGYEDGMFRLHIPLATNEGVSFYFAGQQVQMEEGECWYGNFNLPHRVVNQGSSPRIHMVIDGIRNKWSDDLFRSAGYDFTLEETEQQGIKPEHLPEMILSLEEIGTPAARELIKKYKAMLS